MQITFGRATTFWYRNYKGEVSERIIVPHYIYFGTSEHYKDPQWLLEVYDMRKQALRTFALNNILVTQTNG